MKPVRRRRHFVVRMLSPRATRGILAVGHLRFRCALGRSGTAASKREGDGATPRGSWPLRRALYRRDRLMRPRSGLALCAIRPADGWCDQPADRNYNRPVRLPYPASAEEMWRTDDLYDLVVVLGHNDRPRVRGRGSAIFLHVARAGLAPTAGCVALDRRDAVRLLALARRGDMIRIGR